MPPVTLELRPSLPTLILLAGAHLVAIVAIAACALAVAWQSLLMILVVLSGIYYWRRYGYADDPGLIRRLDWRGPDHCELYDGKGGCQRARLVACYCQPWLLVLVFAVGRWRRRALLVTAAGTDSDDLRRLRVQLLAADRGEMDTDGA